MQIESDFSAVASIDSECLILGQGMGQLVPSECLFIKEITKHISALAVQTRSPGKAGDI